MEPAFSSPQTPRFREPTNRNAIQSGSRKPSRDDAEASEEFHSTPFLITVGAALTALTLRQRLSHQRELRHATSHAQSGRLRRIHHPLFTVYITHATRDALNVLRLPPGLRATDVYAYTI